MCILKILVHDVSICIWAQSKDAITHAVPFSKIPLSIFLQIHFFCNQERHLVMECICNLQLPKQ